MSKADNANLSPERIEQIRQRQETYLITDPAKKQDIKDLLAHISEVEQERDEMEKRCSRLKLEANCGGVSIGRACSDPREPGHEIFGPHHGDGKGGFVCEFHYLTARVEAAEASLAQAQIDIEALESNLLSAEQQLAQARLSGMEEVRDIALFLGHWVAAEGHESDCGCNVCRASRLADKLCAVTDCPDCDGKGRIPAGSPQVPFRLCPKCKATGKAAAAIRAAGEGKDAKV